MKTLRAIIADDEELARQILREYLAGEPDIEIIGECPNGFEAVKAVNELRPDLLFLDIQMPKLDGFEVLELIESSVAVVFVTAYDQYAMRAFDAAAVDYLLKPFTAERFRASLDRVRTRFAPAARPETGLPCARRIPRTPGRQRRSPRPRHRRRQTRLRRGAGRLRRSPQRRQDLAEA